MSNNPTCSFCHKEFSPDNELSIDASGAGRFLCADCRQNPNFMSAEIDIDMVNGFSTLFTEPLTRFVENSKLMDQAVTVKTLLEIGVALGKLFITTAEHAGMKPEALLNAVKTLTATIPSVDRKENERKQH